MHIPRIGEKVRSLCLPGASTQGNQHLCLLNHLPQQIPAGGNQGNACIFLLWIIVTWDLHCSMLISTPNPPLTHPEPSSFSAPLCPVWGPELGPLWPISSGLPWALTSKWVWAMGGTQETGGWGERSQGQSYRLAVAAVYIWESFLHTHFRFQWHSGISSLYPCSLESWLWHFGFLQLLVTIVTYHSF